MTYQKALVLNDRKALSDRRPARISLALRPKNKLYLSDALMLAEAIRYLREVPESKARLDIADLDMDMQRGRSFLPYCFDSQSLETQQRILGLIRQLVDNDPALAGRIVSKIFSEWLEDPAFSQFFIRLFNDRSLSRQLKLLVSGSRGSAYVLPFSPVCPTCHHSSSAFGRLRRNKTRLAGRCQNEQCTDSGQEIAVKIDSSRAYTVFYFLDNAGDVFELPGFGTTDMHFTGLDLSRIWGTRRRLLGDLMHETLALLAQSAAATPAYYETPRISSSDSEEGTKKMGFDDFLRLHGLDDLRGLERLVAILKDNDTTSLTTADFLIR